MIIWSAAVMDNRFIGVFPTIIVDSIGVSLAEWIFIAAFDGKFDEFIIRVAFIHISFALSVDTAEARGVVGDAVIEFLSA